MKTKSYLLCTLCVLLQSFNLVNAQVVWLTTKNMDFTNCDREERDVKDFTGVTNSSSFDVIFEQSKEPYVIVESSKLLCKYDRRLSRAKHKHKIYILDINSLIKNIS